MDFSKIRLANERNSHVTKRLNRLSTWKFFKVLYRENIWRLFGYNFLMLLCMVPILVVLFLGSFNLSTIRQTLPMLNSFGFSTGAWTNVGEYLAARTKEANLFTGWMTVVSSLLMTVMFSGGFAVIRDAFWTGKFSTVGIFKSMWKGFKANILYAFLSTVIIALMVFGIYVFYVWFSEVIFWLAIVLTVLLGVIALFVVMYLLILCSVSVTYKQSVYENMDDSWRLLWLNVLPNLVHVMLALIPLALYFLFANSMLQTIYIMLMIMFGGLFFPLVWQSHMMRTFALFHPVEVKKKKQSKQAVSEIEEYPTFEPAQAEQKPKKKGKKQADTVEDQQAAVADEAPSIADSEMDAYAQDEDDAYKTPDDKD